MMNRTEIRRMFREIEKEADEAEESRPKCPPEGHIGPPFRRFDGGRGTAFCQHCGEAWPKNSALDQGRHG